ncbi:MAG: histidine phosphatase family protein [Planctomycetaceae bacterium]|nr:histidine phosphatase family protein [Planctomycetaceae bacterium]
MATVVLIRAGWTDYDDQHRLLGTLDMPVNDKGTEQIRTLVRQLQDADLRLQAVFSCPEDPAASTAAAIHESQPWARLKELDELRNVNQGLWQGLPEADIRKRFPRIFHQGKSNPVGICPPEGETLSDACQRLSRVLSKAIRKYETLAIVAPEPLATVIRCTLQQRRPHVNACLCGEEQPEMIQVIQTTAFDADQFVSGDSQPEIDVVSLTSAAREHSQ